MSVKKIIYFIIILGLGLFAGYWFGRSSPPVHEEHVHEVSEEGEALYTCPMHPQYISEQAGDCPICGMSLVPVKEAETRGGTAEKKEKKILYWQAPMDPTYIREEPGKSPMGMDLVPVYEEGEVESEAGVVRIDPVTVQNMGVRTAAVEKRSLSREIRTVGRVAYNEKRVEHVHAKMEGWVEKLFADFTGEEVKKGAPLLSIYSPELVSTQEEYLLALKYKKSLEENTFESISEGADSLLASTRKRLEFWDITQQQIDELEKRGEVKKTLTLHSPTKGVVIEKMAQEGMFIQPGMNLYTIADISQVWVYADIYEYELPWLVVGQEAEVQLSYLKGKSFHGRITYIYPFLDKNTRTVKVRMEFENPNWELKPEMYANVKIRSKVSDSTLAVPVEAVLRSGDRDVVIVAIGAGKFMPRDVQLGAEGEGYYQVLSGLAEGDLAVTSAQFLIDSESKLKEAISKMLEVRKSRAEAGKGMDNAGMEHETPQSKLITALPEEIETIMDRILEDYFTIQQKLKGDTIEGIQPVAVEIATLSEEVKSLDKAHALHKTTAGIIASVSEMLSGEIKTVREGFKKISRVLADYVKTADPEGARKKGLKVFYCPMVKEEWIQKGETTENPFYGATMLKCGTEVKY
jgi:RND family efflux transporter MFP subunit